MVITLDEYYIKNYSQFNVSYSFLASWQGLAYPSRVIQLISLPLEFPIVVWLLLVHIDQLTCLFSFNALCLSQIFWLFWSRTAQLVLLVHIYLHSKVVAVFSKKISLESLGSVFAVSIIFAVTIMLFEK
ncbi:hypothetical protein CRE_09030 [Caenorhabditis remanei]|uniref:Uncharacterized protein n=1 Tax=Caenorhabditis remanei TaxID=31234 RepID=E3LIV8_CAERE|nr:hypothetical protein CRE_09030 [Caenorhabditis remanei]